MPGDFAIVLVALNGTPILEHYPNLDAVACRGKIRKRVIQAIRRLRVRYIQGFDQSNRDERLRQLDAALEALDYVPEATFREPSAILISPTVLQFPPWKRGFVRFFNFDRGFGFIRPDDGSKDVFLSISRVPKTCTSISTNHPCAYVLSEGAKGIFAKRFALLMG